MKKEFELKIRFVGVLYNIGILIKKPYYFEQFSIFWSINRLFSFYYRIISVYNPKTTYSGDKSFLDADLEGYVIRHRIIQNDIAYSIWQLLELCGFDIGLHPKGGVHPKNKELSFFDLNKKLSANTDSRLDILRTAVQNGAQKFGFLKDQRDNISHYKSAVFIFGNGPDFEFAIMNAAGTMPMVNTEGVTKLALKKVFNFVNEQHLFLWGWLNGELTDAVVALAQANNISANPSDFPVHLSGGSAIALFKEVNNIK